MMFVIIRFWLVKFWLLFLTSEAVDAGILVFFFLNGKHYFGLDLLA